MSKRWPTDIAFALALALLPAPALAGDIANGNDFADRCSNLTAWCFGYASGHAARLIYWRAISPATAPACISARTQADALVEIGLRYIDRHPELRAREAGMLLGLAWIEAWPCNSPPRLK